MNQRFRHLMKSQKNFQMHESGIANVNGPKLQLRFPNELRKRLCYIPQHSTDNEIIFGAERKLLKMKTKTCLNTMFYSIRITYVLYLEKLF